MVEFAVAAVGAIRECSTHDGGDAGTETEKCRAEETAGGRRLKWLNLTECLI